MIFTDQLSLEESSRNLATVQEILDIKPIPDADAIECVTVQGWQLVTKKGEFKVGDRCVYIEIDSVLPKDNPYFEFMQPRGYRVKTAKLRGQISQGICFPLHILPTSTDTLDNIVYVPGTDVTALLGITKYNPPIPACLAGTAKGNFPGDIPKTDEPRIQGLYRKLASYKGVPMAITEKLDGSSVTCYLKGDTFGVCSRNLDLLETEGNSFWKVVRKLEVEKIMRGMRSLIGMDCDIALQGELVGEGIQKNKYNLQGQTIYFFSAYNITPGFYLSHVSFLDLMEWSGLPTVPVVTTNIYLPDTVEEMVGLSKIKSALNRDVIAEGIVVRNMFPEHDRVSFKVINPDFLLKHGE